MRVEKNGISVHAIAGARNVLFGFDATPQAQQGLLGFTLGKRNPGSGQISWMRGFKFFEETVPDPQPGERRSTREHPIQGFQWGDYGAEPATTTDYVIQAVYGSPTDLSYGPEIEISATTGNDESDQHSVFFNRGAIPSQAFADRFGNVGPSGDEMNDPDNEKVKWLSRGLLDAVLTFIRSANGPRYELRVAAYEFFYPPVIEALKAAAGTGAKIQVCYDGGDRKRDGTITYNNTSTANKAAVETMRLNQVANLTLHPRTMFSKIPHNKFFVLLKDDQPIEILTGSTNITPSGFLGQSNVAHVVRDPGVAERYNRYWKQLARDPGTRDFKRFNNTAFPDPEGTLHENSIQTMFSPRKKGLLEWIAREMDKAENSVMFTAAFGVADQLVEIFEEDKDYLRFILMERRDREDQARLMTDRDTRIALGTKLNSTAISKKINGYRLDEWFRAEEHFRTRGHVFYIHTKFMLLDALSENPQIFSGSANFSDPSVEGNDENMLLMRGPDYKQVAQIYLTEFMRLFNHLYFRTVAVRRALSGTGNPRRAAILEPDDRWVARHFNAGSYHDRLRNLYR
ncbi:phospholipase D-like domain-containing protein [Aestuariispira insulae]|uniref:Phospholipase D n=1 Tax=Aestuariispira insulae TaxID=1461337 RepID=A0A3D9H8M7_9PROT|nr:phospholipase D-like domain-containing protein [Aestuariispira insulae]RED45835.1 phosphatidylserine/phosphatidylglycerophosphate/cardiolipin synthase-like enzyme [Aestuariispira insulae]